MNPEIDLPPEQEDEFYVNPTYLSFGSRYDYTAPVLSSTFLNDNQFQTKENLSITPIHSNCNVSFAEKYLFVQTPPTPHSQK